ATLPPPVGHARPVSGRVCVPGPAQVRYTSGRRLNMSTVTAEPEYRLLHGQTWQDYQRALAERERLGRRYRITYDQGLLEIMPISAPHGRWQYLIVSLLTTFAMAKGI